ncbi:hypothetical protein PPYR_03889 [Photinus pyralis]|uniref:Uncharacterized protein n=1 Tax=Photinus pyralis TaxID=7054 RepID=A0A5N4AWQ6_PHOPY|nr:uncharacterized protein LOC116165073 [Photinus pyralis]KAB0801703.1 hypothetical protein PPYR_03889 [Photinus pyralis]
MTQVNSAHSRNPPAQLIVPCPVGSNVSHTEDFNVCRPSCSESSHGVLAVVEGGRNVLARYQERRGLSKYEPLNFVCLMGILVRQSYYALAAIFMMILNLLALLQGFLYLTRFIFDKTIDISNADGTATKVYKLTRFIVELLIVVGIQVVVCIFMVFPVCHLIANMYTRVLDTI